MERPSLYCERIVYILICDDNTVLAAGLAKYFQGKGCQVAVANTARQALEMLHESDLRGPHFDAVIFDVNMPDESGPAVCLQMNNDLSYSPTVVFLTAEVQFSAKQGFELGADAVFYKQKDDIEDIYNACVHFCQKNARLLQLSAQVRDQERFLEDQVRVIMLGDLAASIVHDVASPLFIIFDRLLAAENELKTISQIPDDVKQNLRSSFAAIERNTNRILSIVNVVRSGIKKEKASKRLSLRDELRDAFEVFNVKASHHSVTLSLPDLDEVADIFVECVPSQLYQIVVNLFINAVDAVSELEVRWVKVEVDLLQDRLKITIIDSGNGVSESFVKTLFTPFSSSKGPQGSGMGLYVSRKFARAMGGDLVYTKRDGHTAFELNLPFYKGVLS